MTMNESFMVKRQLLTWLVEFSKIAMVASELGPNKHQIFEICINRQADPFGFVNGLFPTKTSH